MTFAAIRAEASSRLAEVRTLVVHIASLEGTPPIPDPAEARILKSLFFVHLYAYLEFTVTTAVDRLLLDIDSLGVQLGHFENGFYPVALDGEFNALKSVGEEKRWPGRQILISRQSSTEIATVSSAMFAKYLMNCWPNKLETLFQVLAIHQPTFIDPQTKLAVEELVDTRNGIAHGRFSAQGRGGSFRVTDLQSRFTHISEFCNYILDVFETHYATRSFLKPPHRRTYPDPTAPPARQPPAKSRAGA